MKKCILGFVLLAFISPFVSANASTAICVNEEIQDGTISAVFKNLHSSSVSVRIFIPTGETTGENATGQCLSEEDSNNLSLRCDSVKTDSGAKYFARIDQSEKSLNATIAYEGKIIAFLSCREK